MGGICLAMLFASFFHKVMQSYDVDILSAVLSSLLISMKEVDIYTGDPHTQKHSSITKVTIEPHRTNQSS